MANTQRPVAAEKRSDTTPDINSIAQARASKPACRCAANVSVHECVVRIWWILCIHAHVYVHTFFRHRHTLRAHAADPLRHSAKRRQHTHTQHIRRADSPLVFDVWWHHNVCVCIVVTLCRSREHTEDDTQRRRHDTRNTTQTHACRMRTQALNMIILRAHECAACWYALCATEHIHTHQHSYAYI